MNKLLLLFFLLPYFGISQNYIPTKDIYIYIYIYMILTLGMSFIMKEHFLEVIVRRQLKKY